MPWSEWDVGGDEDEVSVTRSLLTGAMTAAAPEPVRAALLRGPGHLRLLLIFDHAVMDETSLRLVTRDLFGSRRMPSPDERASGWQQYRAAVWRWLGVEEAAATEEGIAYWVERLGPIAAASSVAPSPVAAGGAHPDGGRFVLADLATVAVPSPAVRATLFPRLLAAAHAALQTVDRAPSTVIYPWGARPDGMEDVVGCFMNTVLSGASAAPGAVSGDRWTAFLAQWWRDLDHAGVPYDDVVLAVAEAVPARWSGTARCVLVLEDVAGRASIGPPSWQVTEWLPRWLAPKYAVNALARFDGSGMALRVVTDPRHVPAADGFMAAWRREVAERLSC